MLTLLLMDWIVLTLLYVLFYSVERSNNVYNTLIKVICNLNFKVFIFEETWTVYFQIFITNFFEVVLTCYSFIKVVVQKHLCFVCGFSSCIEVKFNTFVMYVLPYLISCSRIDQVDNDNFCWWSSSLSPEEHHKPNVISFICLWWPALGFFIFSHLWDTPAAVSSRYPPLRFLLRPKYNESDWNLIYGAHIVDKQCPCYSTVSFVFMGTMTWPPQINFKYVMGVVLKISVADISKHGQV